MQRDIFASEHNDFRDMVRAFIAKEVTPYHEKWEADKMVSRDAWLAAGRAGLLGIEIDEKYGGGGAKDYRHRHDRAGGRQRLAGHAHHRGARRR